MSAARLAELLRRFKLPPSASQAELRRSYYKRAKLLHPDIAGEASEADFKRLREDYDEASQLLQQAASGYGYGRSYGDREGQEGPWDQTYTTPGGQQWTGAAFRGNFHGNKGGFRAGKVDFDPRSFRESNRSHSRSDAGQSGYSYQASGRAAPKAPTRSFNPAQVFKTSVLLGVTLLAGQALSARLRRDAMEFRGGKVYS